MTALLHALANLARLRWLGAAFCTLAMLCVTTHASAFAGATAHGRIDVNASADITTTASATELSHPKDRVWDLDQNSPLHVCSLRSASAEQHPEISATQRETASASSYAARGGVQGPVVIGETMARVEQAASKIPGAKILNDMPDFKAMGMNPEQVTSAMMQHNRKWMLEQFRSGRQIIDIGADANRATPSIFYQMEKNMLKNYQKLHPEFGGAVSP